MISRCGPDGVAAAPRRSRAGRGNRRAPDAHRRGGPDETGPVPAPRLAGTVKRGRRGRTTSGAGRKAGSGSGAWVAGIFRHPAQQTSRKSAGESKAHQRSQHEASRTREGAASGRRRRIVTNRREKTKPPVRQRETNPVDLIYVKLRRNLPEHPATDRTIPRPGAAGRAFRPGRRVAQPRADRTDEGRGRRAEVLGELPVGVRADPLHVSPHHRGGQFPPCSNG